jgi:hypothetical protein
MLSAIPTASSQVTSRLGLSMLRINDLAVVGICKRNVCGLAQAALDMMDS